MSAFLSVALHAAIAAPLVGVEFGPAHAHGFTEMSRTGDVAPTELVIVKRLEVAPVEPEPEVPVALPEPEPEPVPEEVGVAEPPPTPRDEPKVKRPARKAPRARAARAAPAPKPTEPAPDEGHAQRLGVPTDDADADAPASDLAAAGAGAVDDGPPAPPAAGSPDGVADGEGADDRAVAPGVDIDELLRSYLARVARAVQRDFSYPRAAVRAGLEGQCMVIVTIDADGRIVRTELDGSSGHSVLDRAALAAATSIKRVPKAPVELGWTERQVKIPFTFRLRG